MSNIDADPLFTSICSAKTLQSDKNGFFNLFYQSVSENFSGKNEQWLENEFRQLKTDLDKLKAIYEDPVVCFDVLGTLEHVKPVYRQKDAIFSWQKRDQAMKFLNAGNSEMALLIASQAVMKAPAQNVDREVDEGLTLAMAFYCRAEILVKTLNGKMALRDLQYASKCGFKVKENPIYYALMAKAYSLEGEDARAAVCAKLYHQLNGYSDHLTAKLNEEIKEIFDLGKTIYVDNIKERSPPQLLNGPNKELAGASNSIEVIDSTDKGRYVIAKEDIVTGQTVLVEEPFTACLFPKFFGTHCVNCLVKLVAAVGCNDCCGVAFCSFECRDQACNTYHKYECKFLDLMIGSGMSILCHVALRLITQAGTPAQAKINAKKLLGGLCTHSEKREGEDYFQRALMSGFLLRILQKADFFGRRTTEAADPTHEEYEIGELLLGLLQSLQFNAHEIYETRYDTHKFEGAKVQYIGVGIYATGCLFNHSCHPGVSRHFLGTKMILTTAHPVKKNEPIYENYGPHFLRQTLTERQRNLSCRYWFKCDCDACEENWPLMKDLNNPPRLRCTTIGCTNLFNYPKKNEKTLKCWKCKQTVSFKKHVDAVEICTDLYNDAANCMNIGRKTDDLSLDFSDEKTDEAIALFKEGIDKFYQVASTPHKETHIAQESLRACLADKGSVYRVKFPPTNAKKQ